MYQISRVLKAFSICMLISLSYSCKQQKPEETATETTTENTEYSLLKEALTFYASFDRSVNADLALGDDRMYTVPNRKARDSAQIGLHKQAVKRVDSLGKFGAGLVFTERSPGYIYYKSEKNIAYDTLNWSASISFWLRLDPALDLEPGYCDPIQITDVGYNDAGIWVDFTKENPRDFRLGVIGDRAVWNPNSEGTDNENPIFNARLTPVQNPPFSRAEWTHVFISFSALNTKNGKASLYLNGEHKGTRSNIDTPFTWDYALSNIYLGLGYIGHMDDLSIFNRALTEDELKILYTLENGVKSIF